MHFIYRRPLHFADTDMAGVGHFAAILTIVEEAWHAWLRQLGECVHPATAPAGADPVGWPVVSIAVDFAKPVRFGDEVSARLSVDRLGTRSIRLGFSLQSDNGEFASGTYATACTHLGEDGQWHSRRLPASLVRSLQES